MIIAHNVIYLNVIYVQTKYFAYMANTLLNNIQIPKIHGKNDFAEILKNLARCRSDNNFVGPSK